MPTGKEIMEARLLQERKQELEMKLKEGKKYEIFITSKFDGKFSHFEDLYGEPIAVFTQEGRTDRGLVPTRRVKVKNIVGIGIID